jgi:hypothetical protein
VALLGKVKGEHHDRCHLLPCSTTTSSGINVKGWLESVMNYQVEKGIVDGPLFVDKKGKVLTTHALDEVLIEMLEDIYDTHPNKFPQSVTRKEDLASISGFQNAAKIL